MDKAFLIGGNGAGMIMKQLEIVANNLANSDTVGFRADYELMKQKPMSEQGMQTRILSQIDKLYSSFQTGSLYTTGRDLDVAISGDGFFTVQTEAGEEAFTRGGNFQLSDSGVLKTQSGDVVLGVNGVIRIPPSDKIEIRNDGKIFARLKGQTDFVEINQLKLVNPNTSDLHKGKDGFFYLAEGVSSSTARNVKLLPRTLEGSNVNPVDALARLVDLSRRFEFQTSLIKNLEENDAKSNQLIGTY